MQKNVKEVITLLEGKHKIEREAYCQARFKKMSQRKAYIKAFGKGNQTDRTIDNKASKLEKQDDIQARLKQLEESVASENIMSEIELQEFWTRITKDESVDLKDRIKTSELLGKNKKMFTDKVEHSGTIEMPQITIKKAEK